MDEAPRGQSFQMKKKSAWKKKQQANGGDIVYIRQGSMQTIPSLAKRLKTVTDPVIGLQYVWEYRSPTRTVPPHYQCRLCKIQQQQNEIASHLTGWKHCFKYLKQAHSDKMPHEEAEVMRNPVVKKEIKVVAAEVEKAEGRGRIKVVFKEPYDVSSFQNMKSAFPSGPGQGPSNQLGPISGGFPSGGPLGGGFMNPPFAEEFPPLGDMMSDFHGGLRNGPIMSPDCYGPDRMMEGPGSMQRSPNSRSMRMSPDRFGMGPRGENMGRAYPDNLPMNDRMIRSKGQESSGTLATLLRCLDSFRIECEEDAQIVLKITQKLTDVLMDYRLRAVSSGPGANSSCLPMSSDRFSSISGPSRFYN